MTTYHDQEGYVWHCWQLDEGILRVSPEALDRYPFQDLLKHARHAFTSCPKAVTSGHTHILAVNRCPDLRILRHDYCSKDIVTIDVNDSAAYRRYCRDFAEDGQHRASSR